MASREPGTGIYAYLAAVTGLSILVILMLYALFTAGFTDGIEAFLADPPGTLQDNPLALVYLVAIFAALLSIFALVVVVGARHAHPDRLDPERDRTVDANDPDRREKTE